MPNTLSWTGSRNTAPDTPTGAVTTAISSPSLHSTARCGEHDSSAASLTSTNEPPDSIGKAARQRPRLGYWRAGATITGIQRHGDDIRVQLGPASSRTLIVLITPPGATAVTVPGNWLRNAQRHDHSLARTADHRRR